MESLVSRRHRGREHLGRPGVTLPQRRTQHVLDAMLQIGIEDGAPIEFDLDGLRPRTRGECIAGVRPCPWVGCAHHLYLEVIPETGSLKLNFPHQDLDELVETCALDVADKGPHTLDVVGQLLNVTRERVRQLERRANHLALAAAHEVGLTSEDATGFAHAVAEGEAA